MKKLSLTFNKNEICFGTVFLLFQQLLLPSLLLSFSELLVNPLTDAELNLLYFLINFLCALLIFRKFIWKTLDITGQGFFRALTAAGTAYLGYYAASSLIGTLIYAFFPDFINLNDASISQISQQQFALMAVGTVLLVPPVEELLFRGLIFGNIYNRNRFLAYVLSTVLFSLVHLLGYWNYYTPTQFAIAFLQYLPAGVALGWAYAKADTIVAPILLHTLVNLISTLYTR